MNEREWVRALIPELNQHLNAVDISLRAEESFKLVYASEILRYDDDGPCQRNAQRYETDILVTEKGDENCWTPRVVIEVKLKTINTHTTIAYSQKAATHKGVHPHLRYGVMLADRGRYPLPGRLFRHGAHFDFMLSWTSLEPNAIEWGMLIDIIISEVKASRNLEEMIYNSRSRGRMNYVAFHKPLVLKQFPD